MQTLGMIRHEHNADIRHDYADMRHNHEDIGIII